MTRACPLSDHLQRALPNSCPQGQGTVLSRHPQGQALPICQAAEHHFAASSKGEPLVGPADGQYCDETVPCGGVGAEELRHAT